MTSSTSDPVLLLLVRGAFALLFASAAWHKLRDRAAFRGVVYAYRLLPDAVVPVAAFVMAALELAVAVAWIVPAGRGLAAAGTIALLALYATAIAVNLARGRRTIDCGCGIAGAAQPISEWLLARNAVLAGLALVATRAAGARPLVWIDALTVAAGLVVVASVWTAGHGLAAAAARVRAVGAPR